MKVLCVNFQDCVNIKLLGDQYCHCNELHKKDSICNRPCSVRKKQVCTTLDGVADFLKITVKDVISRLVCLKLK